MRRLTAWVISALLATAALSGAAGARGAFDCPVIEVSCPDTASTGVPVTFTASVKNAAAGPDLAYNWIISAGTIEKGQGTDTILLDTTGLPHGTVTATVEVRGLPASCPNAASCTVAVIRILDPHDKLDEYGNIRFEDEMARLDNFAIELQNWPQGKGYIVAYDGRRGRRGAALERAERAKRYVTGRRHIPARQVVTIDGGYREELTIELRVRGQDMPPPEPAPTVDPSEVQSVKPAPRHKVRGRGGRRRR